MTTVEELERLAEANRILNRSSKRLGTKPLFISDLQSNSLNVIAAKLKKEKLAWEARNSKFYNVVLIFLLSVIMISAWLVFQPEQVDSSANDLEAAQIENKYQLELM